MPERRTKRVGNLLHAISPTCFLADLANALKQEKAAGLLLIDDCGYVASMMALGTLLPNCLETWMVANPFPL